MSLPELIEIVPLTQPVRAEITVPGSKSITNRALILAALADGEVTLKGALWSEDTQVMTEALQKLEQKLAHIRENLDSKQLADEFELKLDVWLAMHENLRATPRCRAVFDGLAMGLSNYVKR